MVVQPPMGANPGGGAFIPPNGGPPPGMVLPGGAGGFGQPPRGGGGPAPLGAPGGGLAGGQPPGFGGFGGGFGGPEDSIVTAPPIAPFYAAAFDAEKKQLVTIGARKATPQGRVQGELRLYDYPSFALKGTYNIPYLGTRMVIDPTSEKGLLYVAGVTNVPTTWGGPLALERNAATGDIQVYELDQVRANKVGSGSDFKPVGSMSVGGTIRGLELSDDASTLFCLTCATTNGAKAHLYQFDTAERKAKAGTKPMQFQTAASELRKTADGKSLLVVERGANLNLETKVQKLTIGALDDKKPLQLAGSAADVAVIKKDGTVVAAVGNPTGAGKLYVVDPEGRPTQEIQQPQGKLANGLYVGADPDGKHLFVGSYTQPGFDAYEVTDLAAGGLKKLASARNAGGKPLQGAFLVAPDGEYIVFHIGTVLKVSDLKNVTPGAFGAGGGAGGPPGAFQPPGGGGAFPPPAGGGAAPQLPQGPPVGGGQPTSANPGGGRPPAGGAPPAALPPPGFGTQGGGAPGPKGAN
jgi:hypothetical protein